MPPYYQSQDAVMHAAAASEIEDGEIVDNHREDSEVENEYIV